MNKKIERIYYCVCIIFPLVSVYILSSGVFGNTIDWYSQHVVLADCLRTTMIKQGTLFPSFIPNVMGGCNLYEISYYGFMRPDILFGVLFPKIDMVLIIQGYSIFLMILTGLSCYLFLKENRISPSLCFVLSIVVLSSSVFYQAHKQILFVNYIPFVFFGLYSIDHYLKTNHIVWFIGCGVLIILHSYFFALSCFFVCLIYFIYKKPERNQWPMFLFACICIGLCTAILTIPTLYDLLENSKSVSTTSVFDLLMPFYTLKPLLYNPYGLGLTFFSWLCIVLGFSFKEVRPLSIVCLLVFLCPIFCFLLNGTLYVRTKVLLPFLPLVIYLIAKVYQYLMEQRIEVSIFQLLLLSIPLVFIHSWLVLVDVLVSFCILISPRRAQWILILSSIFCLIWNNPNSSFINSRCVLKDANDEISSYSSYNHRVAIVDNHQLVNETFKLGVYRASGYTSSYNSLYNQFLFDTLSLNVSINNRVSMLDSVNPFYLQMMSIDTIQTKQTPPIGYAEVAPHILKCENVLPIAYATKDTLDRKTFDKIPFPYCLDVLYGNTVVSKGGSKAISSFVINETKKNVVAKHNLTWNVLKPSKVVAIEIKIDNKCSSKSVAITVNGMKNVLSSQSSGYYNDNTTFHYVLSSNSSIEKLYIQPSSGNYTIKEVKIYSLIEDRFNRNVDPLNIEDFTRDLKGTIDVKSDGYFVTSIPYKEGFTLRIDGKKQKIEVVNTAFVGSKISKGRHKIQLTFQAPGKTLGIHMSFVGFLLYALVIVKERIEIWKR